MSRLVIAGTMAAAVMAASLASAQQGGGRNYDVTSFDEVAAAGPMHVLVTVGPQNSVRAEGPRATLDKLEVVVEHGSLQIRPKHDEDWRDNWHDLQPATFYVSLPRISKAAMAGSGDMQIDRVKGGDFAGAVAGSGGLNIATLAVDDASFSIAGSGNLTAQGTARRSKVSIAGSGNIRARKVASDSASISIVGSGDAALTVRDVAKVTIMGSGDVDIAGSARCTVTRMGSGHVRCNGRIEDGEEG